jgi:hypothetical protein
VPQTAKRRVRDVDDDDNKVVPDKERILTVMINQY